MSKFDKVDALNYWLFDLKVLQVHDELYSLRWPVHDFYHQRDLYRRYGLQQFPKEAPVLRTEYRIFSEGNIDQGVVYTKDGWADPEAMAIKEAERLAQANPGRAYYVRLYKSITKSYVDPKPPVTARL